MDEELSPPIPVLYADNTSTFGGAINALAHLLPAINEDRYRPVVLSAQSVEYIRDKFPGFDSDHWNVELSWVGRRKQRRMPTARWLRSGPLRMVWNKARAAYWLAVKDGPETVRLTRYLRRKQIRMVHLNNGVEGMLPPLLAASVLGLPVVAHARGPQTTKGMARAYARLVTHWIAVSQSIAENLLDAGVDANRITVVHDAIDLAAFQPGAPSDHLRRELSLPPHAKVFGVFARVIPWKGIREFVLAAERVIREVPDAFAIVVGDRSDGSELYYDEVVELSRSLGVNDRIRFTGFREDVADLMRLCAVAVHTSTAPEPFGMTVIEAMATGTPVVAANAGGPTEIITDGLDGILADPTDTEQLSAAIIHVLQNPHVAANMGRQSAIRAQQHYSADRYARDVERVYERVLQQGTHG